MQFAIGAVIGVLAGGVLSYLYAQKVIADYHKAAAAVGVLFKKVEGKIAAIKL